MTKTTQPGIARRQVEGVLRRSIPDEAWEQAVDDGLEEELDNGTLTAREVARRIRAYGSVYRTARGPTERSVGSSQIPGGDYLHERALAISAWVARAASADSRVVSFRRLHLRHGLVAESDVGEWIRRTYTRSLPHDWPVSEQPRPGWAHTAAKSKITGSKRRFAIFEWAELNDRGEWKAGRWPVPRNSALAKLATIAEQLERRWRWSKPEASLFVLTGYQPYVTPIRATASIGFNYNKAIGGSYDVLSRVTITLDPTITPEQLASWWRPVRKEMLDKKRHRSLSGKHFQLAAFMADRDEQTSWNQDRQDWNRAHRRKPAWRYMDRRTFRRDALLAMERVLHVGLRAPKRD